MTSRRLGTALALSVVALATAAFFFLRHDGIMPLDEETLGRFREAQGEAMRTLLEEQPGVSTPVRTATAFHMALEALGYDPDRTLLYWMSPEFKQAISDGDPSLVVVTTRRTDSLLASALGDGADEDEFARVLSLFGPELRAAAERRRP